MAGGGVYSDCSEPHHAGHLAHQDHQGHQSYLGPSAAEAQDHQGHQSYLGPSAGEAQHHQGNQSYLGPSAAEAQDNRPAAPTGELVQVFTAANPNYRLTIRQDAAVLAFKNSKDLFQQWIKVDVGPGHGNFVDREGQPGFILVNKETGHPLKHGVRAKEVVTLYEHVFGASSPTDGAIIWSLGRKDEGHGFKGIRPVTNITLNLEAEHANRLQGGVRDGNRLVLNSWLGTENYKWKIQTSEPVA